MRKNKKIKSAIIKLFIFFVKLDSHDPMFKWAETRGRDNGFCFQRPNCPIEVD